MYRIYLVLSFWVSSFFTSSLIAKNISDVQLFRNISINTLQKYPTEEIRKMVLFLALR